MQTLQPRLKSIDPNCRLRFHPCNNPTMRLNAALLLALAISLPAHAQKRLVLIDQDGSGPGGSNQMSMLAPAPVPADPGPRHHHGHRQRLARRRSPAHPAHARAHPPHRHPRRHGRRLPARPHPGGDRARSPARRQCRLARRLGRRSHQPSAHGTPEKGCPAASPPSSTASPRPLRSPTHAGRRAAPQAANELAKTPSISSSARSTPIRIRSPSSPPDP